MSAMDLLCEPKTLVAEIGKLFSKVATFAILAMQHSPFLFCNFRYLYYAINNNLLRLSNEIKPKSVPDELILNKYAYLNNCYKQLSHKYNVNPYYSYKWLKNNKNKLTSNEKATLREYEEYIQKNNYSKRIDFEGDPVVRHFFGPEKPWKTVSQSWFIMPYTPHFKDFWYYAKITPYFEEIKQRFINECCCQLLKDKEELKRIKASNGYKLLQKYYKIRDWIMKRI